LQKTLPKNSTLLVDGPASVEVIAGKAFVFGKLLGESQKIMIREGKRKPFYATEALTLQVLLGANAAVSEVEGSTVPESWNKPFEFLKNLQVKPAIVIIMGASDAGKSSFSTYLLNKLIEAKQKVGVLDGDLGQSDLGSSATVGYTVAEKQVTELGNLRMQNGFFVGATSPTGAMKQTLQALGAMMKELQEKKPDYIIINTDGFINGEIAIEYKLSLIKELKPNLVIGVQAKGELEPIFSNLGGGGVITIEPSTAHCTRSIETRKIYRERTYAKYLEGSKLLCIPMNQLVLEPRNAIPKMVDPNRGLIVGLYGSGTKFLGIGVLRAINQNRKTLKIQTAVPVKPMRLVFGKVELDRKLQEVQAQVGA
jgi:polynucleotide 5'-hydroxyl-kinase GRC3/NOL9